MFENRLLQDEGYLLHICPVHMQKQFTYCNYLSKLVGYTQFTFGIDPYNYLKNKEIGRINSEKITLNFIKKIGKNPQLFHGYLDNSWGNKSRGL